jgi:hypothetical protein
MKEHIYFFFLSDWRVFINVQRTTEAGTGAGIEVDDEEEEVE